MPVEITRELVERIARFSKLTLTEEEKTRMCGQLETILGSMTALERLTLEEEEDAAEREQTLRPDEVGQSMARAELLLSAPVTDGEYILTPGVNAKGEQK